MSTTVQTAETATCAAQSATYVLRLFVAGNEPNSTLARANLTTFCETYLQGRYQLETIDVLRDFQTALRDHVLVTPTLKVVAPVQATIFGNLSDTAKVLAALQLS